MHAAGVPVLRGRALARRYNRGDEMVELFLVGVLFVAGGGTYLVCDWISGWRRRGR